jgi:YVTN family beta-propeller protein
MERVRPHLLILLLGWWTAFAQWYSPPAGLRPPLRLETSAILPGGRILAPAGDQSLAGFGPFALALSPSGKTVVTANLGPGMASVTVIEHGSVLQLPANGFGLVGERWNQVSTGIAFSSERSAFVSEGNTGRVAVIDLATGELRRAFDLNRDGYADSFTAELAADPQRSLLYVADVANRRVAIMDTRTHRALASVSVRALPFLLALSPDRRALYAANVGGADMPGANTVSVIDVSDPANPKLAASIGVGAEPSGIAATAERIYVANAGDDSISVIDARTYRLLSPIPIQTPLLEQWRGVLPAGLAYEEKSNWLLVAEAGINAVAIIDTASGKVLGHIPVGWFPTHVLLQSGTAFVTNLRGEGAGPSASEWHGGGTVSSFRLPSAAELEADTRVVMRASGLVPRPEPPPPLPRSIRYLVLIVKGSHSFDEILGDLHGSGIRYSMGMASLARLGGDASASGAGKRLSLKHISLTPNQHAMAGQFTFFDNFYAGSDRQAEAADWLFGAYPSVWREALSLAGFTALPAEPPESQPFWKHLQSHGISFAAFGGQSGPSSASAQVSHFLAEIEERYAKPGVDLPHLLYLSLPDNATPGPDPENGYPYVESYAAGSDYELGRILEYLARSKWWKQMAVFITESAGGELDHIDAQRTPLLCAGPWAKRGYAAHTNTDFASLRKTIEELFGIPSLNLFDASAADLGDCFRPAPDVSGYKVQPEDPRVYDPAGHPPL